MNKDQRSIIVVGIIVMLVIMSISTTTEVTVTILTRVIGLIGVFILSVSLDATLAGEIRQRR